MRLVNALFAFVAIFSVLCYVLAECGASGGAASVLALLVSFGVGAVVLLERDHEHD